MDRRSLWAGALVVAALACGLPNAGQDSKSAGAVETQVAATLTAISPATQPPVDASPTAASEQASPTAVTLVGPGELAVVYTDGGHPWLWTADDGSHQLSETGNVVDVLMSDDAQRVVFVRREPSDQPQPVEIRAIHPDGSGEMVLLGPDDFDSLHPLGDFAHNDLSEIGFIPDSHALLLNTRALPEGPGLLKYNDLLRLDADSGDLTTLLPAEQGGDFVISPDGSKLALVRPDSVSLAAIDGSLLQDEAVTFEPVITYSEFQYYVDPVWTPDSSAVYVAVPSQDPLADQPTGTVWRIPASAGEAADLATFEGDLYFPQLSGGSAVSAALEKVAYFHQSDAGKDLYLANVDGSAVVPFDSGDLAWEGWSPDGAHFVYRTGGSDLLVLGVPGEAPYNLVSGDNLIWVGPDSFLFRQGSIGNWSLYRGWIEGADPQLISEPEGDFISYAWARP